MALAEFGRFPLHVHFWQHILRYHHRTVALDNTRLVKLAMLSGCTLGSGADQSVTAASKGWQCHVEHFLARHS